jgi:hypothetical protein
MNADVLKPGIIISGPVFAGNGGDSLGNPNWCGGYRLSVYPAPGRAEKRIRPDRQTCCRELETPWYGFRYGNDQNHDHHR